MARKESRYGAEDKARRRAYRTVRRKRRLPSGRIRRYKAGMTPFHLAFAVHDLDAARAFYGGMLGCTEGRSSDAWIDFDFFGHQIVAHLVPARAAGGASNPVDGHDVPVPHFGAVLAMAEWQKLAGRLEAAGVDFAIPPTIRFKGLPGEQATMFFRDPSGNALEIKAMRDPANLFARS